VFKDLAAHDRVVVGCVQPLKSSLEDRADGGVLAQPLQGHRGRFVGAELKHRKGRRDPRQELALTGSDVKKAT
jgi:hypothetical protein